MKTSLNAVSLLALCLVALSAQTTPGQMAGAGSISSDNQNPDQNVTLRLQGNVSPNLPIDITLTATTASPASQRDLFPNKIHQQIGTADSTDGFVPTIDVGIMLKPVQLTNTYTVVYNVTVEVDLQPGVRHGRKTFQGTVLLKPGQTVKVLDAPSQGNNFQFTLTKLPTP
jgi:hypothetical protein